MSATTPPPPSASAPESAPEPGSASAAAAAAAEFFRRRLAAETDPMDVYEALRAGDPVQLVDVRSVAAWSQGHAQGARHIPYREIPERISELDPDAPVVVYCWSPGCNAGVKGALAFAEAGFAVKEMIGGFEYWAREGLPVVVDDDIRRSPIDPLVGVVS